MKKLLFTILLMVLVTNIGVSAETVRLCGIEWPPFTYAQDDHIVRGVTFDILTEAFRRLAMDVEADNVPWPRCIEYVKEGTYDAVIDNIAEESFLFGSHPTSNWVGAVYVRHDFPEDTFSWDHMKGKTIGIVRGYPYPEYVLQFDWNIDWANTDAMALQKLQGGRYDYALVDYISAPNLAKQLGITIKRLTPAIVSQLAYSVSFNKEKADLAQRYDAVIGDMIQDGAIEAIYQKYVPEYLPVAYHELINIEVAAPSIE